jgi:hypothetical protein
MCFYQLDRYIDISLDNCDIICLVQNTLAIHARSVEPILCSQSAVRLQARSSSEGESGIIDDTTLPLALGIEVLSPPLIHQNSHRD